MPRVTPFECIVVLNYSIMQEFLWNATWTLKARESMLGYSVTLSGWNCGRPDFEVVEDYHASFSFPPSHISHDDNNSQHPLFSSSQDFSSGNVALWMFLFTKESGFTAVERAASLPPASLRMCWIRPIGRGGACVQTDVGRGGLLTCVGACSNSWAALCRCWKKHGGTFH